MDPDFAASREFPLDVELAPIMREISAVKQQVTTIFEILRDPVYRYLFRVLGNPQQAEDLTQEVFLRLYVYLHKGQTVNNIRAWVFRVAQNLAVDQQRRKLQFEGMDPTGTHDACDPSPGAEQQVLAEEQRARLQQAWATLSLQEKHCLELRAEGLSYKEMADILEMRMPTVVKYFGRIIKKLRKEATND